MGWFNCIEKPWCKPKMVWLAGGWGSVEVGFRFAPPSGRTSKKLLGLEPRTAPRQPSPACWGAWGCPWARQPKEDLERRSVPATRLSSLQMCCNSCDDSLQMYCQVLMNKTVFTCIVAIVMDSFSMLSLVIHNCSEVKTWL